MKKHFFVLLVLMMLAAASACSESIQSVSLRYYESEHFEYALPEGWNPVSSESLVHSFANSSNTIAIGAMDHEYPGLKTFYSYKDYMDGLCYNMGLENYSYEDVEVSDNYYIRYFDDGKTNYISILHGDVLFALIYTNTTQSLQKNKEDLIFINEFIRPKSGELGPKKKLPEKKTSSVRGTSGSSITQPFTNKYGTATTRCAHSGCNSYIASSGDTNCCPSHSKHCAKCGKYIDEDAFYCMQCLSGSTGSSSSSYSSYSSNGSGSFTNKYGTKTTKCAHAGCSNYIASSGDTNCCPSHSKHCAKCGKYIDEDAMYCMQCLLGY